MLLNCMVNECGWIRLLWCDIQPWNSPCCSLLVDWSFGRWYSNFSFFFLRFLLFHFLFEREAQRTYFSFWLSYFPSGSNFILQIVVSDLTAGETRRFNISSFHRARAGSFRIWIKVHLYGSRFLQIIFFKCIHKFKVGAYNYNSVSPTICPNCSLGEKMFL